jgi:CheY-like chemotaxis protein
MLDHPIRVRSWPDRGSVFSVDVPVAAGYVDLRARGSAQSMPASTRLSGIRVLCVDNEFDILEGMQALMEGWGCEVLVARGLEDALAVAGNGVGSVDVMLADYHLDHGVNGIDVMEAIQGKCGQRIPGIVITADHTEEVRRQSLSRGYRFLQKPLKAAALRAVLNRLTGDSGVRRSAAVR